MSGEVWRQALPEEAVGAGAAVLVHLSRDAVTVLHPDVPTDAAPGLEGAGAHLVDHLGLTVSFQTAALTLSWIVLVVLALGLAGTLQAVRRLPGKVAELATAVDADPPGGRRRSAARRFAPERHAFAFVMTSSAGCRAYPS